MKIELTVPDDFIKAVASEVVKQLKSLKKEVEQAQEDTIYDVPGLAKYLNVTEQWVYDRVVMKEIPYFKLGKYNRFKRSSIDKWVESQSVPAVPSDRPLRVVRSI